MSSIDIRGKQIPLTLLAVILVVAGAGAAAGVTMSGDVQGDATTKVDQSLVVNELDQSGVNNGLGTVSDDNTSFKHSANINQGDEYTINMNVTNRASQNMTGRLVLDVPEPLEVEIDGNGQMDVARTSMYKWQFEIGPNSNVDDDLQITIATPDDVEPGFYTIDGQIKPTET